MAGWGPTTGTKKTLPHGHVSFVSVNGKWYTLPTTETFGLGDHLGLGRENWVGKSGIWKTWFGLGKPIWDPYGSEPIRMDPNQPWHTLRMHTDPYGGVRECPVFCQMFSEMFGRAFRVFDKFGLAPTGPVGDGVWPEPTRIDPYRAYGSIRTPPGPFWAHMGTPGPKSPISRFSPWALPGTVSVVALCGQPVPTIQKRHSHVLTLARVSH